MKHKHQQPQRPATASPPAAKASGSAAPAGKSSAHAAVPEEEIRRCAYQKWERAGKPTDDGVRFWLEAEQELRQS